VASGRSRGEKRIHKRGRRPKERRIERSISDRAGKSIIPFSGRRKGSLQGSRQTLTNGTQTIAAVPKLGRSKVGSIEKSRGGTMKIESVLRPRCGVKLIHNSWFYGDKIDKGDTIKLQS